ncbi:serine hydrolase domain-containing protein [Terracoccus luteus]|uniref:CubicO group peptidase (Beta-lactamase class C family) n=1 Tax=Terracoccus luteus TaxID=53356 RepID=A0A839PUA0_9MICO|nr:serine hydrolase domain-containing protein [Terracoccus luteus]MBB2986613.1 CubicO group peptidase (beta-lactamase class C family) [Terracoccus luteus]MCP2171798.1 CubicO group peptidase (beta-lactamase class C family) [Terracoccus luteus]
MSSEHLRVSVEDELDALFAGYPASGQSTGLVYGLVGPDGLGHSRGFGTVDDAGAVPDLDTVFPIASMSKSFVACAALVARDRGLLDLDAPVSDLIPEFPGGGTALDPYDPPTLRMLFSMGGGLTEDNSWVDPFIDAPVDELLVQLGKGLRYSGAPGSGYEYSNLGFTLAGLAVGRAAGTTIEQFVHDEVFVPLGLTSTWFDNAAPEAGTYRRATGYSLDEEGRWTPFPWVASGAFAAAGGIQSSVRDLARWVTWLGEAFRSPGEQSGEAEVLSRASRRELQRLHQLDLPSLTALPTGGHRVTVTGYALGLMVQQDLHRGTLVSHAGGLPGFTLFMCWHPDSGHGVVTLTNSHRGNPVALTKDALMLVLDRADAAARTVTLWPETVELRRHAESLVRVWDDALAAEVFADNVDFDRPLALRRDDIARLVEQVGPLHDPRPLADVTSAVTPADVTWTIPGERGELVCMIHLTPVEPAQIQEFEVQAVGYDRPRSARPTDISARRAGLGHPSLNALPNTRVLLPPT